MSGGMRDILSLGDESECKGQARIGLGPAFGANVSLSCSARHSELKECGLDSSRSS